MADLFYVIFFYGYLCVPVQCLPSDFPATNTLEVKELLLFYARCGITYKIVATMMERYHGVFISENAVRKRLKRYGEPSRRGSDVIPDTELSNIIEDKLKHLPRTVGYRQMTAILKHSGHNVRRNQVMSVMRQVDPEGVYFRRRNCLQRRAYLSPGPNFTWHIDGYDKLKPYGFPIHGCIDGYSRKILWLVVGPSNNDPKQVAFHYMSVVKSLKGIPSRIQADKGTENTIVGALQCVFKENDNHNGELQSFQHIASQLNQRIEAWWSMFRRRTSQWWMDFFKDLVHSRIYLSYDDNAVKCMRFCFLHLIQKDLDDVVDQWNNHQMSISRNSTSPNGRPNVLFSLPELSGGKNYLHPVDDECITFGFTKTQKPSISGDEEFDIFAMDTSRRLGWKPATTWKDALQQYVLLRELV